MVKARWTVMMAAGLLWGGVLAAQQPEQASLGVQLRGSLPMGDLKRAVGNSWKPGVGASVVMEEDFLDGIRGRLSLGADAWFKGDWLDRPGVKGSVAASHLSVEWVRLLRTDADAPLLGPYLTAGLGLYAWTLTTDDTLTGVKGTRQVSHAAATLGFGWRLSAHQDVELKGLVGRVDTDFIAMSLTAAITFRY